MEKFRFWCQKVLPLVYDDSLSYYELLCKVVKYINDIIENMGEISKELEELVSQFNELKNYLDTHLEDAVSVVLEKWLDSGKIEQLLNNILAQAVKFNSSKYSVYVHTQKIIDTKITDIAQGFCTDGTYFYMLHHTDDTSPLKLLKMTKTGELVNDVILKYSGDITVTDIHGNSLCYYNGFLYAAFAGSNTHNILKINAETFLCEKLTTTLNVSSFGIFEVDGYPFAANVVSKSQGLVISYIKDGNLIPFTRYVQMNTVPNLKQGLLTTGTHIYLPYSALYMYRYNMIRVYTQGLQNTLDLHIIEYPEQEMEDLARVSGEEIMYWNDSQGNVYSIDTTGVIGQSRDTTNLSAYEQALPHYMVSVNGSTEDIDEVYTSNNIRVTRGWNLPSCYHRTWSGSAYGYMEVLGAWVPVTISPFSGAMHINGVMHLWDGTKYVPVFYRMQYDFIGDDVTLGDRSMRLKNFLFSAGDTDYVYSANATDSDIDKATKWLHDKFGNNVQYITRYGYWVYNTTLNAGSVAPMAI